MLAGITLTGCCGLVNLSGGSAPSAPQTAETRGADSQGQTDAGEPGVENPTAVGQAVDAIAQPAIEEVYGDALLTRASSGEALIVSLWYDIPMNPAEGDGEKLRDALIARGATPDSAHSEMDYHAGEEFMLLIDTGNPAFKTVRVGISPDDNAVYVNADKSE